MPIEKVTLKNRNDDKKLKKVLINQIYAYPEKKIIVVSDIAFSETLLVYIDKINHVTIEKKSDQYQEYFDLAKMKIIDELYDTYDDYIKKKYKIDVNYQALDAVKNHFNK